MKIPTTLWIVITLTRSNIRVSVSSSPGSQWPGSSPSQVLTTMAIMELMVLTMITKKVIMDIVVTTITMDIIMTIMDIVMTLKLFSSERRYLIFKI